MSFRESWTEIATSIGMTTMDLWEKRKILVPLLVLMSLGGWGLLYFMPNVYTFNLAITLTVFAIIYVLIGTIVIEYIEWTGNLQEVPSLVTQTLIAIGLLTLILGYMGGMLMQILPAPPLPFLLAIMYAMDVAPLVTLAVIIPPIVGYFFKDKWRSIRSKYPFWGIYLGIIAGVLTISIPLLFIELMRVSGTLLRIFIFGAALLVLSGVLGALPDDRTTTIAGMSMLIFGPLLWFGAVGGLTFGSVLAVVGGAYAISWQPEVKRKDEKGEVETRPRPKWAPGDTAKTGDGKIVKITNRDWDPSQEEWVYDCEPIEEEAD